MENKEKINEKFNHFIKENWIFLLVIIASYFLFKPVLLFILPGILILFTGFVKKINLMISVAYISGISMAFWICSFWLLNYIPLKLTEFSYFVILVSLFFYIYLNISGHKKTKIKTEKKDIIIALILLVVVFLKLSIFSHILAPTGADMSMHTYTTHLITEANGIPDDYKPIINIDSFDTFPVGYQSLSAQISLLGNMPAYKAVLLMNSLTYVLLVFFLFVLINLFVRWEIALISSLCLNFIVKGLNSYIGWGGIPSVFAIVMLILFTVFLYQIIKNKYPKWLIVFASLVLASVFMIHTIILVQGAYLIGISFIIYILTKKDYKKGKWKKYLFLVILFLVISLPYLADINPSVPETTKNWMEDWVSSEAGERWKGNMENSLKTIPFYVIKNNLNKKVYFGTPNILFLSIICLGIFVGFFKNKKLTIQNIIFIALGFILILNTHYFFLPFSYLIYPARTASMFLIPFGIFFGFGLGGITEQVKRLNLDREKTKKIISAVLIVLLLITVLVVINHNKEKYIRTSVIPNTVTSADIKAFRWIEKNLEESALIKNNYGDAGLWIPSIIFRPVTSPHVNIANFEKNKGWDKTPRYVYIGKKCFYRNKCPLRNKYFVNDTDFKKIYSENGVYIYERKE